MKTAEYFKEQKGITVDAAFSASAKYTAIDLCRFAESYHAAQLEAGIKAKALRKKGTERWYHSDFMAEQVFVKDIPQVWGENFTSKGMIEFANELPLPNDCELIDITIIIDK